jgi:hypothetical protein
MGFFDFEWGGFSPKGESETVVRRMKETDLFSEDGELCPLGEGGFTVISMGGRHVGKSPSLLDVYIRSFSEQKIAYWKDIEDGNTKSAIGNILLQATGTTKYKYELDEDKFNKEVKKISKKVAESLQDKRKSTNFTWHDFIMMILYTAINRHKNLEDDIILECFASQVKEFKKMDDKVTDKIEQIMEGSAFSFRI